MLAESPALVMTRFQHRGSEGASQTRVVGWWGEYSRQKNENILYQRKFQVL